MTDQPKDAPKDEGERKTLSIADICNMPYDESIKFVPAADYDALKAERDEANDELKMLRDREQLTCFAIAEAVKPKMELRDALSTIAALQSELEAARDNHEFESLTRMRQLYAVAAQLGLNCDEIRPSELYERIHNGVAALKLRAEAAEKALELSRLANQSYRSDIEKLRGDEAQTRFRAEAATSLLLDIQGAYDLYDIDCLSTRDRKERRRMLVETVIEAMKAFAELPSPPTDAAAEDIGEEKEDEG